CINHNYQIISENNIFDMLFETMKFNNIFISNSMALLKNSLIYEDYRSLLIDLNRKDYKYVLNKAYTNSLILFMKEHNILNLIDEEKELIKIADSYGLLDEIIQYHNNKFKVLYPKVVLPIITHFDENIDKLFDIIGINEDVKCKN
ncbi:MAG: hypothetical protein KAJ49_08945, partial [Arcobacteraceae bacterium]|nr:hypothetical protein [Arcobacteraceae bacterium]